MFSIRLGGFSIMKAETFDYVKKYRDDMILNIGEKISNNDPDPLKRKAPKADKNGKVPWHNEINEDEINSEDGLVVFCGKTSNHLMIIDLDDETLFEFFKEYLDKTFIVKTGKKGYHIYSRTFENPKSRSLDNSKGHHIDILGQGKVAVLPPSIHPETKRAYEIISDKKIKQLTKVKEQVLFIKLKNLGFKISEDGTIRDDKISDLWSAINTKGQGTNRQGDLIRLLESLKIKNPSFTYQDISYFAYTINKNFKDSYPKNIVDKKIKSAWKFANEILDKRTDAILEDNKIFLELWNEKPTNDNVTSKAHSIVSMCISVGFMVVKSDLRNRLESWSRKHGINPIPKNSEIIRSCKYVVDSVFADSKKFKTVKQISFDLGLLQKPIVFDQDQLTEAGEWVKGRYHAKRIELTGDLIRFNERHYEGDSEEFIKRAVSECLIKHTENSVKEVYAYVKRTSQIISQKEIEKSIHLKCFLNGIYDIKSGVFTETFDHNNIILNLIPYNYVKKGNFKSISKRISEIIPDKKDRQTYYDFASVCALPYSGIDFQLGLVGIAGSGKSKLCQILKLIYGKDNVKHASIHDIAKDPTLRQDIAYKFLNIDEEQSDQDIKFIAVVKQWITQNDFSGRSIYAHESTYRPTTRLMFVTNGIYEIPNPDDALAMYERTHIIKLTQKFRKTPREIKNIWEKIEDESEFDEFVSYLMRNSTEIYKNQEIHYPQSTQLTETLWNEYGNNIHNFIEEWIIKDDTSRQQASDIWSKFLSDQLEKNKPPKGRNQFYAKFDEIIGSSSTKILNGDDSYYGYLGLHLRTIDEKTNQERIDQTLKGQVWKLLEKLEHEDPKLKEVLEVLK